MAEEGNLAQLVRGLKTYKALCRVDDYPGVTPEQLNAFVKTHGPLHHPLLGAQTDFVIDEGRFVPFQGMAFGQSIIKNAIVYALTTWTKASGRGGRVTSGQGRHFLDNSLARIPDVVYIPRKPTGKSTTAQQWTRCGELFNPSFVVEIDTLIGGGSHLDRLDKKMREECFPHGVQLAWLIDPRNKLTYEYKRHENGVVHRSHNSSWRDLDGGDILPGFILPSSELDLTLTQDPGSSSEEEVDLLCPFADCNERLVTPGALVGHAEWHRKERALKKLGYGSS